MIKNLHSGYWTRCLLMAVLFLLPEYAEAHHAPGHFGGPPGNQAIVTESQALAFGTLVPGAAGGTLTVSDTGAVSVTGTLTSLGGTFNALVTVNSCAGSVTSVALTNGLLTGPGANITMTNLTCTGPGGTSASGSCIYSGTAGIDVVQVGGTISIPAGQVVGAYTGTFDVIAVHSPAC